MRKKSFKYKPVCRKAAGSQSRHKGCRTREALDSYSFADTCSDKEKPRIRYGRCTRIRHQDDIVLVSDAGTPAISDPGFLLVRACISEGIAVECLPGATAFVPALAASGLPTDRFVFEGFLPHKKGRQSRWLILQDEPRTMVFYESPFRVRKFLNEVREFLGEDRQVCVVKELTKIHENYFRGTAAEVAGMLNDSNTKGEFVVIVEGKK